MYYYYGNNWKEALGNDPVLIRTTNQLRQYQEVYNVVIAADEIDDQTLKEEKNNG